MANLGNGVIIKPPYYESVSVARIGNALLPGEIIEFQNRIGNDVSVSISPYKGAGQVIKGAEYNSSGVTLDYGLMSIDIAAPSTSENWGTNLWLTQN